MKKFKNWFGFMLATLALILSSGTCFAMADDAAITDPVGDLDGGPGTGVAGANTHTQTQEIMETQIKDFDYYVTQINKHIVEMKLESCPVDQILRAASKSQKSKSIVVKYYEIGQRPIKSVLDEAVTATSNGVANAVKPLNNSAFDFMDTIIFPDVMGYKEDGTTRETLKPLMVRVVARDNQEYPLVIAVNGKKNVSKNNRWDLPDIPKGATMLRLGRAAGEKDVETASYYTLPEPSEQYCQRFIMQAEESIIERMSAKTLDWDFSKQERIAMDDMRDGMERSGLFGIKSKTIYGNNGATYTTGGIYWLAGKDISLGHWAPKTEIGPDGLPVPVQVATGETEPGTVTVPVQDSAGHDLFTAKVSTVDTDVYKDGDDWKTSHDAVSDPDTVVTIDEGTTPIAQTTTATVDVPVMATVYEYVISEDELNEFVRIAIHDAGNGSRTKLLFVDDLIYKAFSNLKSKRRIITQTENNYQNWGLDFESFSSMGTKILIYRHDAFNYMGMSGCAFLLDPRYLEKWVFGEWARQEYDLKKLFIRNSNAVVMEEFSCWTLYYPNAHARVFRPDFDPELGVTDELEAA
ncbi:MAG: hypothetical protein IJQ13_04610 [Prevotella sp.]|nr:hypothetical protein [Prevotella sp.]